MKLSAKLVIGIGCTMALFLFAFGWFFFDRERQAQNIRRADEGHAITHLIALIAGDFLLVEDFPYLEEILRKTAAENPMILELTIRKNGRMVASFQKDSGEGEEAQTFSHDIILDHPTQEGGMLLLGEVDLVLSTSLDEQHLTQQMRRIALAFLILFIVLTTVIHSLNRFLILKRIRRLHRYSDAFEHRDQQIQWEFPLRPKRYPDELDHLLTRMSQMMASIQRKERERDELMEQLRKNQKFLRNVLDSMPSMIVGVDCDKNITHWNQAAAIRTKVNYDDALGQNLLTLFPFLYQEIERVDLAIRTRQPQPKERLPQKAKGKVWFAEVSIFPLIANGIQGAVVRVDDVTDQVRIEEMMVQSEKMLSVGGLAAGMAHEINNPLAGILQNTQVIQSRLLKVTPKTMKEAEALGLDWDVLQRFLNNRQINQMLQSVMDSGQRAAQIVKNMLSFARKNEGDFDAHDPGSLLDATVNLASNDYDLKKKYDFKKIKIVRNYQKTPRIRCNGSKIQQVFLNLLKNAAEALYESPSNPEPTIFLNIANDTKQSVVIEIGDNGPGIPDPLKKRVFEPFFTTKPVGVGTGLGLSVSYFIITENHKGSLRVSSLEPQGTVFTITLPFQPDFSSETHLQEPSS